MPANDKPVLIYGTFANAEEAKRIGHAIVQQRLAACVNIFPPITSIYEWNGKREEATETPMLIKTRAGRTAEVIARVQALHSYETPALLTLAVDGGSADFIAWLMSQSAPRTTD